MIDLYTWHTPNGRKVSILLEELGVDYEVHALDIGSGDQKRSSFLEISPNGKIPAIIDRESGTHLMESGAILLYLGEKHERFIPATSQARWKMTEWLMWQMAGFGPMLGQAHHFLHFESGRSPYAEERYGIEARRLYGVLDARLSERAYVADTYSLADISLWPWVSRFEWQRIDLADFPNVRRWYVHIAKRPAVERGYHVPGKVQDIPMP